MGLLAHIAGGALQGAGQGITNNAIAKRQEALEAMRQRFQTERDNVAHTRQVERDTVEYGRKVDLSSQDYRQRLGILAMGGEIDMKKGEQEHRFTMEEIGAKHVNDKEMARLESSLTNARTEAEVRLRDRLESGEIKDVVKGADGTYYGVTDTGLVATGIAAPTEAAPSGTRLTDSEQEALYSDAVREWREGGKKGEQPRRSDFIGMSRAEVGGAAPETPKNSQQRQALSELGTIYANATPDRYPGLFRGGKKISLEEAKAQIRQRFPN